MAFARWDPIRDLLAIQQHLERYAPSQAGWKPPVDLQEAADRYVVTAELPGVKQEDVHVAFNGAVLTLSGVRRANAISPANSSTASSGGTARSAEAFTCPSRSIRRRSRPTCATGYSP
jgi:HSP20 family molecular chaperone IbpA